jgi:hypothetical protein
VAITVFSFPLTQQFACSRHAMHFVAAFIHQKANELEKKSLSLIDAAKLIPQGNTQHSSNSS